MSGVKNNDTSNSNSVHWGLWGHPSSGPEEAGLGKPIMSKSLQPRLFFWKGGGNKCWSLSFASGSGWFCAFANEAI